MALTRSDVESIVEAKMGAISESIEDAKNKVGMLMQAAEAKLLQVESQAQAIIQKTSEHEERIKNIIDGCNIEFERTSAKYEEQKVEVEGMMIRAKEGQDSTAATFAQVRGSRSK